ncbi:MAG: cell envelope integrity EipB family protein [Rhizobiaceae bacterium]|nr:cell envelope integrity EipB family protein [Rhizobiaceae bacterium]MCV0405207.1 cell envelope integrity EipB family protein [Rhizobiaceae bacterium]
MRMPRPTAALLAAAMLAAPVPALAAGTMLAPHRAVYDLDLDRSSDRSGITGISGRMVYEFDGSECDGYTVTFRFVTRIDTDEQSRVTDQQTTTYEDGKGKSFDFVTKSFVDQTLDKEVRGRAELDDGTTRVRLEKPAAETLELDATQFPTQHLTELIEKAQAGETFYETTLFDGSEDANEVMLTTVIIGREDRTDKADPEFGAVAKEEPFWPVSIAYFDGPDDDQAGEETPVYHISFKLHENGVTRDLVMDYGDFAMTGRLVDLEMLPAPKACE